MSKPAGNPFFETDFTKFMDMSKMMDMTKMMDMGKMMDMSKMMDMGKMMGSDFKMPAFAPTQAMESMMQLYRRNMEAMAAAQQMAWENTQEIARRQTDLARQNIESAANLMQTVITAQTPEEKVARQTEATKATMERCTANLKEVTDMMAKTQTQAMDAMNSHMCETLDQIQSIMKNVASEASAVMPANLRSVG
jgi:phasin family protein